MIENQNTFESPITTVNLSVGAALTDANRVHAMSMLEDELLQLRNSDILVFAAAGNLYGSGPEYTDEILYPASSPSVVSVSSVNPEGQLSEFAQREPDVLATHGEAINSAIPDHVFGWDGSVDDFARLSGTSMATPQVAATAMLIRQALVQQGIEPSADAILEQLHAASHSQQDALTGDTYHAIDLLAAVGEADPAQTIEGSTGSERVELDLAYGIKVRIGGETISLQPAEDGSPLRIDVSDGDDSLFIIGSENAENLVVRPPARQQHPVHQPFRNRLNRL